MHSAISQQNGTARPIQPTINQQSSPTQQTQPSEPARPKSTKRQPNQTPTPGFGERLKSALASLRPQPSATQSHQQALNELKEMILEPETPPPAPPKKQAKKPSEQNIPTSRRPAGASSRPVAATPSLPRVIPVEELFGSDLTNIHFQQQKGNTCYLLAALNGIFHHPQGKRILESIPIQAIPNGYRVQFPGQPNPVDVFNHELGYLILADGETVKGVVSNAKGVQILECAYSRLNNHIEIHEDEKDLTEGFGKFFGVEHYLKAIFGQQNVSLPDSQTEEALLCNALNTQRQRTDFADIWTGQEIHYIGNERIPTLARHYHSIVPIKSPQNNALSLFQVQDSYHSEEKNLYELDNLDQRYQASSIRIHLPIASTST